MPELSETIERMMAAAREPRPCARCEAPAQGPPGALCLRCGKDAEQERYRAAYAEVRRRVRAKLPRRFREVDLTSDEGRARVVARVPLCRAIRGADVLDEAAKIVSMGRGAVLRGTSAVGKTTLAAAMLIAHAERIATASDDGVHEPGEGPTWQNATECSYVRATAIDHARIQTPAGRGEAPIILDAMYAPVLLLDDLGQDQPRTRVLVEILMDRLDNDRTTLVTTSRSDAEVRQLYGEGVQRRLRGADSSCSLIELRAQ
jgi:DNA replication protein DnaC